MHKNPTHRASVLQHVSLNVRRLRNAAGMSQSALAERSGVSRRMLVAIEAGEKNVSLTTLDLIAEALGVAFSTLIQAPEQRDPSRIDELAWAGEHPQSKAVLLGSSTARREVELWEWTLAPGECYLSEADADGWSEQIYVAEGQLTLVIEDAEHRLQVGQFHVFPSNCRYAYRNDGAVAVRFVRNVVI
ncbi:XRE family transcriptional regulator [Pseudomonas sp. P1B16]|uniref:XRE family transcriptional regulator n=1 Tax=Pseudomonas capeferrum TaxID=1495066 RepID=A0ABY7RDM2_9PSED|nr:MULTISPECIES: XRE family transcriptional regulator [Pseudomonas]MBC3483633.1 helix-turn-helix transcriptional regulator [Pseudomonas sp. SWRI77]MBC3504262.1 helix-turn-helix transcriptional regulator [Pseudomonas sp. SWRI59]MBC3509576.1 helix-turn-helix transcriptional regulator [Pseudomonas sp. SWRI68]KEY86534.1 Cro/Cl family transcriptional regulator [Pseudomonas capeferrum]KGI90744.1 Cro/Cl family transcriptional regulator [Pseudomonas sp. H2]